MNDTDDTQAEEEPTDDSGSHFSLAALPAIRAASDFERQTRALRYDAGTTTHDSFSLGAALITMHIAPAMIQQAAMEWEHDVAMYGLPGARALQEMAQTTPYSRRQWIEAWVNSRTYRRALLRGEVPNVTAWLAAVRRLSTDNPIATAIWGADTIDAWKTELEAFIHSSAITQLTVTLSNAAGAFTAFWYAIDPKRCHHTPACFCRPAPFPAARDYRRRTKHRRRRQR